MLKRILLALDRSASGAHAQRLAIDLATEMKAQISGVGILDIPWITAAQPEPLGGTAYKLYRDQELINQTHERLGTLLETFEQACQQHQVEGLALEAKGLPVLELEQLSQRHDIIVMGKKPEFHFELEAESNIVVRHIARDNPRPLLIAPANDNGQGEGVLIAYDGSLQAARALHIFLLLGLAGKKPVHIISIDRSSADATARAHMAQQMCETHGIQATAQGLDAVSNPAHAILAVAHERKAKMIVLGAFGRRGLRDLFFGSVASHLLEEADIPLFVHH